MAYQTKPKDDLIPIYVLDRDGLDEWLEEASDAQQRWVKTAGFRAGPGKHVVVPGRDGSVAAVLVGKRKSGWLYQLATLPDELPRGDYTLEGDHERDERLQAALGWGLAAYRFTRYKENKKRQPRLALDEDIAEEVEALLAAQTLVRDLVNTPTEHMGPAQLTEAVEKIADKHGGQVSVIEGDALLDENYPAIHAVGRAAATPPRLIRMDWGDPDHPVLALVGKGVCFDSGGLDIKPAAGMLLMKKDMGGAAHVIALARLVMQAKLPVRLLLLVPAVENAIAGNSYRPGDIIDTRKGLTVEIGNTDAEGRVILSDALALACEEGAEVVIDFATLTGAARIALGADLPPVFSNDEDVAQGIWMAGDAVQDPVWVMPLYQPYKAQMKSPIADLSNISKSPYGGCITAALFLEHFVDDDRAWVHIDTFAWNQEKRPGRPPGGEALGLRAVWRWL